MNITYSKRLGRRLLLVFLIFAILFSVTFFFVRNRVIGKLTHISNLAINASNEQSRPERALLLLHQAEDNFQQSLLDVSQKKINDYKNDLAKAFREIDTLLKDQKDTSYLSPVQNRQIKLWYIKKIDLSAKLYSLRHSFDSLLFLHSAFQKDIDHVNREFPKLIYQQFNEAKTYIDTVQKTTKKKGLFRRIRDAIINKEDSSVIQINKSTADKSKDQSIQKAVAPDLNSDRNVYLKKLKLLQEQNSKLHNMQRELTVLNTNIINRLENIINEVKDNNYDFANSFKALALKNYQETASILNKFSLINLVLILILALFLIIFIVKLNKAELLLRRENEQSVSKANETIETLIRKIELKEDKQSESKIEELKEVVKLAIANNPAFIIKFNDFDPDFCKKILQKAPNLVATETEFCVMARLNFETKEIARYTKSSVRAVESKKYRIRKKLGIPSEQDFNIWMSNI
ncbi:helix-turn-helix transcriptional regulator [Pedobacter punctiformis]|uniref:HTH luxR-type domain-containing protein n=1 Tax=Pedobacter punctiformis TaxID=3004097 RepID=A0ABT4L8B9_9SPHI|nr:hypothetical protein [Pedobacter sp. HCMS5-2]MCZ4244162.1 hypothetical protein [Pedobacter sp. HCMS5-2]